jgi:phosphohistidine phosphatase SixA
LQEIASESNDYASLLVAGHEPTWSSLVYALCGARVRMVTAGLARIDFDVVSWADVGPGRGVLTWFVPPKLLLTTGWAPE